MTILADGPPAADPPSREATITRRAPGGHDVPVEILFRGICPSGRHTARGEWPGMRHQRRAGADGGGWPGPIRREIACSALAPQAARPKTPFPSLQARSIMSNDLPSAISRRGLLASGGALAAAPILVAARATAQGTPAPVGSASAPVGSPAAAMAGVMPRRRLGALEVSALGLGVQNMSRTYQTTIPDRGEMHAIIRAAFDQGVTLFDAAEAYGPLEVERILGEATQGFRDEIAIATKFGWNIDPETGRRLPGLNSRPEHIRTVVEQMLGRLRTDRIDLLYQHRVDPAVPIEDVAGAIRALHDEGKVLHWGLSEMGLGTLRRAHAAFPLSAVQSEYSMLWRGPETGAIPVCAELDIGFVCWSPLGVGFLTGAIDAATRFAPGDIRALEGRFAPEALPGNLALVALLRDWAARKAAAPGQIALAWLMAQKPWIVPIPGTTQMAHMRQNIGAAQVSFSAEELSELTTALNAITISGARLPDAVQAFSDVEAPLPG